MESGRRPIEARPGPAGSRRPPPSRKGATSRRRSSLEALLDVSDEVGQVPAQRPDLAGEGGKVLRPTLSGSFLEPGGHLLVPLEQLSESITDLLVRAWVGRGATVWPSTAVVRMASAEDLTAAVPPIRAFWARLVTAINDSIWWAVCLNHRSNSSVTQLPRSHDLPSGGRRPGAAQAGRQLRHLRRRFIMPSERQEHADPSPTGGNRQRSSVVRRPVPALTLGPAAVAPFAVPARATSTGGVARPVGSGMTAHSAHCGIRGRHGEKRTTGGRSAQDTSAEVGVQARGGEPGPRPRLGRGSEPGRRMSARDMVATDRTSGGERAAMGGFRGISGLAGCGGDGDRHRRGRMFVVPVHEQSTTSTTAPSTSSTTAAKAASGAPGVTATSHQRRCHLHAHRLDRRRLRRPGPGHQGLLRHGRRPRRDQRAEAGAGLQPR